MIIVKCKRTFYLSLLKNSRLKLRFTHSISKKVLDVLIDMPRKRNPLSGKIDTSLSFIGLEVLGNTSTISPCAVSLNTTTRSYLFNCGEGVQRILSEYRIKPSKYQNIFFTYPSWKNIGGLVGTALAMQESNVKSFAIHGHPCLGNLFNTMRNYVNFKGIQHCFEPCDHNTKYSDEFITVNVIHLHPSTLFNSDKNLAEPTPDKSNAIEIESTQQEVDSVEKEQMSKSKSRKDQSEGSDAEQTACSELSPKSKQKYAISYIICTEKSTGSLCFEKCMDLGVPVGPLLAKLKKGEDVQLEDGKIVKSSDVKFPDLPGVIVIVVECPSEDYLDSLLNEPAFFKHERDQEEYTGCAVVHFSSSKVVKNEKYQEWISRFAKDTKHIFINESTEICAFVGLHRHQFKLNMVHPEIFPLLQTFGIPEFPRIENSVEDKGHVVVDVPPFLNEKNSPLQIHSDKIYYQCVDNNSIYGETLCEVVLKPKRKFDYSKCLTLKKNEYLRESLEVPNLIVELEKFKNKIQEIEKASGSNSSKYPKIVFLGTGSKKPSKTRNASGILVVLDEKKSIILDCGESTYSQLLIFYGKERTKEILRTLSAVFVSHMHVDHHLGLTTLLMQRKLAFNELNSLHSGQDGAKEFKPLPVIAPVQIMPFFHYLCTEIFDISDLFKLYPSTEFIKFSDKKKFASVCGDLNLESIETVEVNHTAHSFGLAIKHLDGWKLTYSGDTKPCENLVNIGQGSDILIHEATFDDIYENEAKKKLHSTTGQAILIGREMNAKFILLTHFSQRYCHLPMMTEQLLTQQNVGVAFDFMQLSPQQLPLLPYLYEPIRLIFSSYQEKLENMEAAKKLKREFDSGTYLNSVLNKRATKIPKTTDL